MSVSTMRWLVASMVVAVVVVCLVASGGPVASSSELLVTTTGGMIDFSSGQDAVLTRNDFVPLSRSAKIPRSSEAQAQLRALFAAAGVSDPQLEAREQELTEVSQPAGAQAMRPHKDIDGWAQNRLTAASKNDFTSTRSLYTTASSRRRIKLQRALDRTMGRYFATVSKP